ncbi:Transcription initiation factor TFIID subunit 11 [Hyphodiscus hymeniophilus]|uniref:Transcription initiation factor TFIID subunit 11 n=1 Tax=Hyphodiscus hymeniophilus TaxID=353542 RepID=A0A9P7AU68_9HELO|nr:Transcription initiation factor TFIID subunit 11 [Hyphodiscus hymeniophilus]
MASPPYNHNLFSQGSPPYPSNTQLPQSSKRRQSDMPSSAPSIKRRKASMLSTTSVSSHPLRQTSFPPPESATIGTPRYSRSPSIDTMSLASASVAGCAKKKRGRKSKAKLGDDESVIGGKAKSAVSGASGSRKRKQSVASADEEDEGGEEMAVEMVARTQEERQKEIEHRAMLVRALDDDQMQRYEAWRSVKLPDATVRRIVNQTLSQSAPASVILAVKSVAKIFAGEMIEGARRVQEEWVGADDLLKETIKRNMQKLPTPPEDIRNEFMEESRDLPRGPLEPDHLREALRRYRARAEGGMVGQLGLWQHQSSSGVERFGTKIQGKRLFNFTLKGKDGGLLGPHPISMHNPEYSVHTIRMNKEVLVFLGLEPVVTEVAILGTQGHFTGFFGGGFLTYSNSRTNASKGMLTEEQRRKIIHGVKPTDLDEKEGVTFDLAMRLVKDGKPLEQDLGEKRMPY